MLTTCPASSHAPPLVHYHHLYLLFSARSSLLPEYKTFHEMHFQCGHFSSKYKRILLRNVFNCFLKKALLCLLVSTLVLHFFFNMYILLLHSWLQSVQSLSLVQLYVTPWNAARQASLSNNNSQSLLKLMSIESLMPSNHLILCCTLFLPPSIIPSLRIFSNESVLHIRWLKYWSFRLNISPSKEQPGLISFRMGWLDLLAAQGTLKSLLQHHSSKASILQCSAFIMVQLSHPYWKNHSID